MAFSSGIVDALDPQRLRLLVELRRRGSISAAADACRMGQPSATKPGSYVLPSILECFAERHPRVDVDVVIGSSRWVAERVARREVSLGMAGEVDWPDGVIAEPFLDDEVIGIAPPDRLRARVKAEELAGHTWLVREPGSSTRAIAERYLARVGYRPDKRWELDSNEAIKRTVRAGLGIGFVSRLVADEEIGRGELEQFTVEGVGSMRRSGYLLRPDGRGPVPAG